jgi:predicted MPP superfamily phosphohydrolase
VTRPEVVRPTTLQPGRPFQFGLARQHAVRHVELPIENLPAALDGYRIVHLTDWHVLPTPAPADMKMLDALAADPPDLILITGDYVDDRHDPTPALSTLRRHLARLPAPAYGIWGNHDVALTADVLGDVKLIDGQIARLTVDDATLELIGLPGQCRTDSARPLLQQLWPNDADVRIVLSHYPDNLRRLGPLGADLWLAGHTHGGQVCLPGGRPILMHDTLGRPHHQGLHRLHNTWLLVGRGLGCSTHLIRTFCPSEWWRITLRRVR